MKPEITKDDIEKEIEDSQTILRTDVELESVDGNNDILPPMTELLPLTPEQEERLKKETFDLFEELVADRKEYDGQVNGYEAQYGGEVLAERHMEFNLNVPVTPMKCDAVERLAMKAFIESDPKFSCSLRPEAVRKGMDKDAIRNIERDQEDYLDYVLDERINIASPMRKTIHQSVILKGGIVKVPYFYKKKRCIREEYYSGKRIDSGKTDEAENPIYIAEGLTEFLRNYPKATLPGDPAEKYFKQLAAFEDVRFKSKYNKTVYDDAKPIFVDTKNFWVRKTTEGYDGLCDEQIYIERVPYTYWEMDKMQERDEMVNVEKMQFNDEKLETPDTKYKLKIHNTLEITYYFKMNPEAKEETKIICRFGEGNKVFLGAFEYPYDAVECIYVPFYITDKTPGFYKNGLAEKLTDSNNAQNAMLNMMLTEAWLELVSTPITREGSTITNQLLSKDFRSGVPLTIGASESIKEEIGFLDKPNKQVGMQMIPMLMYMAKLDDSRTGVSDIQATGNADPSDKRAPAAKTAMLLKQSGINIEDYINCLMPSFNIVGKIILQLTYQMSHSGRKFRTKQRAERVTGGKDVFSMISRDDMILETVIQSQAGAFAFNKIEEINKNTIVWQSLRNDPIVSRDPDAVREMAQTLLDSVSPKWKAKSQKILLTDEMFNQKIAKVGIQALQLYIKSIEQQTGQTGVQLTPDMNEYLKIVAQLMAQVSTPTEDEAKAAK